MRIFLFFIAACSLIGVSSAGLLDSLRNEAKLSEKVLEKNFVQIMEETVKKETSSWDSKEFSVPQMMGLSGCYITQTQERHQTVGGGMYAYDIGCGGKRFDVFAPNYAENYTVEKIDSDALLGHYVVLGYTGSDGYRYHLLYGHTEYILSDGIGLVINQGQHFGTIVMEGVTTGPHVHVEKWGWNGSGDYVNISFEGIENPKSEKLINQRNNREDKKDNILYIAEQVRLLECPNGYHTNAYRDVKQRSIGCGTKSYSGETITEKEAEIRMVKEVRKRYNNIKKEISGFNINQKAALIGLHYNCISCYKNVLKNPNKELWLAHDKACKTVNGIRTCEKMSGLTKRRNKEWNLFVKNPLEK